MRARSNKTERRQQRLAAEREEELRRALTTPRHFSEQIPGAGFRILQVARVPAFELTRCFEICEAVAPLSLGAETVARDRLLSLRLSVGAEPGSALVMGP